MLGFDILGIVTLIGSALLVIVFFILAFRKSDTSEMDEDTEESKSELSHHIPKQV